MRSFLCQNSSGEAFLVYADDIDEARRKAQEKSAKTGPYRLPIAIIECDDGTVEEFITSNGENWREIFTGEKNAK